MITLQKGVNKVDFSWRGVNIDPTSHPGARAHASEGRGKVLNTSYPPNENALIWEIASGAAQEERVRISYLLSGLNRDIIYEPSPNPTKCR